MEEFTVFTTLDFFVSWLNGYGLAHQYDFKRSGKPAKYLGPSKVNTIHHIVTVRNGTAGFIGFDIVPVNNNRLTVAAWTFSQMNVIGRITPGIDNPYRDELELYFTQLIQAIKTK